MSRVSPTIEGFRAAFRRPSFTLAEISWRWTVGASACAVLFFAVIEFLNTLPVTNGEILLLRTRHPVLVGQALSHIFRGSLNRAVLAGLTGALALACLWILAASVGRSVTLRALMDYFDSRRELTEGAFTAATADAARPDLGSNVRAEAIGRRRTDSFRSLIGLNFLRAAVVLSMLLGLQGAAILASFLSSTSNPRPGLVFLCFLPMAAMVGIAGWLLNWFLSLAGMFAVREGEDALAALSDAVAFCRKFTGPVFAVSLWSVLAHFTAFSAATSVVSVPLGLAPAVPGRLVVFAVLLVTLSYFAIADWLYVARFAGYMCILGMPAALVSPASSLPSFPIGNSAVPLQTTIDREELILSDAPNPAD
jgi:hypothetical protein